MEEQFSGKMRVILNSRHGCSIPHACSVCTHLDIVINLEKSDNHAASVHTIMHAHLRHTCIHKQYRNISRSHFNCVCRLGRSQQSTCHCPTSSWLHYASVSTSCPSTQTYRYSHSMCGSSTALATRRCCTNTSDI